MAGILWLWRLRPPRWPIVPRDPSPMLRRLFNARLLQPADLKPSQSDLEVIGAFNPGAIATREGVTLLVRVAEQPVERRTGQTGLPRWDPHSKKVWIDWEPNNEIAPVDIRVVRRKRDG